MGRIGKPSATVVSLEQRALLTGDVLRMMAI
jgi:hypothetical protein